MSNQQNDAILESYAEGNRVTAEQREFGEGSDLFSLRQIAGRLSEKALREAYDIVSDECHRRGIRMCY